MDFLFSVEELGIYQRINHNPQNEEGQHNVQKRQNIARKTKDRVKRTQLKSGAELTCSRNSSYKSGACFTISLYYGLMT